jgi:hypothetical protein
MYITGLSQPDADVSKDFLSTLSRVKDRRKTPIIASHNKLVFRNLDVAIYALSPQDAEITDYIQYLVQEKATAEKAQSGYRFPSDNKISVVLWVEFNNQVVLLGGDLENNTNPHAGWTAILTNHNCSTNKASVFKVPHHGSKSAHDDAVWEQLTGNPISILSVFSKSSLPTESDKTRIKGLSSKAILVGKPAKQVKSKFKHAQSKIVEINQSVGLVRLRKRISTPTANWDISCFGAAAEL